MVGTATGAAAVVRGWTRAVKRRLPGVAVVAGSRDAVAAVDVDGQCWRVEDAGGARAVAPAADDVDDAVVRRCQSVMVSRCGLWMTA